MKVDLGHLPEPHRPRATSRAASAATTTSHKSARRQASSPRTARPATSCWRWRRRTPRSSHTLAPEVATGEATTDAVFARSCARSGWLALALPASFFARRRRCSPESADGLSGLPLGRLADRRPAPARSPGLRRRRAVPRRSTPTSPASTATRTSPARATAGGRRRPGRLRLLSRGRGQADPALRPREADATAAPAAACADCHRPHELPHGKEELASCDACHGDVVGAARRACTGRRRRGATSWRPAA